MSFQIIHSAIEPNPWIPLVDTAIKVGLGAVISGVTSYFVAKHTSKSAITKLKFENRNAVLSEVSQQLEQYYDKLTFFAVQHNSLAAAIDRDLKAKRGVHLIEADIKLTKEKIQTTINELEAVWLKIIVSCQSRLLLLGERAAEQKMMELCKAAVLFVEEHKTISTTNLKEIDKQSLSDLRHAFYDEIHRVYKEF